MGVQPCDAHATAELGKRRSHVASFWNAHYSSFSRRSK
ncbi:phosphopantetheine adenylyltransferase [Burkholderia ubonensis]|uniref:Phosphopantetheine adenylyltransferase n=1 Tax=Burkholderia ubonensis TaxID=101571 RepID=A0AB74CY10_9BURK|nr:phosphopantetheine adenylyltransferase [Burkholderia ubonensis]RQP46732.1 phosphopantetheine adenylyltransferase [Burkholderia ubonensis]RQP47547.1 phosphopantetheine adenylyltransferase [Burkholderia ubonensis]RQP61582.1 phosphopantetheine adenylyltransferase [Burkholderia ubonensis]RQP61960.1 phosphopantetheine adenylyltransferase [Burkholderia ubonensis]